jgi:hypothetical protein
LVPLGVSEILKFELQLKALDKLTQLSSISAIHVERLIALVQAFNIFVKNQAVGTKLFFGNSIIAFIIFVALKWIGKEAFV